MKISLNIAPLILLIYFLSPLNSSFAQKHLQSYHKVFTEVKKLYGDTCSIGVRSKLIESLYHYKKYPQVNNYLKKYSAIRKQITEFRKLYQSTLSNDNVILLSLPRIFKSDKQCNVVNAAGIYFGPDSLTNIALSYFIIKNNISHYFITLLQVGQIDQLFKNELSLYGNDWYFSEKLKQIANNDIK